ncbi:carboxypeptidase-like regulatory domain-containing protein [Streptomyces sp. GMY02]|uniref:carboxypeptidase-like regulatory domain-containing protein n=1 Tax=Streptomyces sp. GMY02 TaxID=1333528 RepID=UPI0020B65AB0|nr:carboxypeptidase-like regulatory domain-containing protein [Streptomyces sp. GMY02]
MEAWASRCYRYKGTARLTAWLDRRLSRPAAEPREERPEPARRPSARPVHVTAVHGFVRSPEGEPVGSATLTLLTPAGRPLDRVESLADGSYILAAPAPGPYVLLAASPGHEPGTHRIDIPEEPVVHDLTLPETPATATN